jgi:hypothetical protein
MSTLSDKDGAFDEFESSEEEDEGLDEEEGEGGSDDDIPDLAAIAEDLGIKSDIPELPSSKPEEHFVSSSELVWLSSLPRLRSCGRFFIDEQVIPQFAERIETSPFPLLSIRELYDEELSTQHDICKTHLNSGLATWTIFARMIYYFGNAIGASPPRAAFSMEEMFLEKYGGEILPEEEGIIPPGVKMQPE